MDKIRDSIDELLNSKNSEVRRYGKFLDSLTKENFYNAKSFLSEVPKLCRVETQMLETYRRYRLDAESPRGRWGYWGGGWGFGDRCGKCLLKAFYDEKMAQIQYSLQASIVEAATEQTEYTRRVSAEFREHAAEEYGHSVEIEKMLGSRNVKFSMEERIWRQMGDFDAPHGKGIEEMIRDDINAENKAVAHYRRILSKLPVGTRDYKTIEKIMNDERKHLDDLLKLGNKM